MYIYASTMYILIISSFALMSHLYAMEQHRKISFFNESDKPFTVMFKGVIPILLAQTLEAGKLKQIPKEVRRTIKKPHPLSRKKPEETLDPLTIPARVQKKFYSMGQTIQPSKTWQGIELCRIMTHQRLQNLQHATHFHVRTQSGNQKSDEIKIEDGAHYRLNLLASGVLIKEGIE